MQAAVLSASLQCGSFVLTRPVSCPTAQPIASCSYTVQQPWPSSRHAHLEQHPHRCPAAFSRTVIRHARKAKAADAPTDDQEELNTASAAGPKRRGRLAKSVVAAEEADVTPASTAAPDQAAEAAVAQEPPESKTRGRKLKATATLSEPDVVDEALDMHVNETQTEPKTRGRKPKAMSGVSEADMEATAPPSSNVEDETAVSRPASARRRGRSKAAVTDAEVEGLPSILEPSAPDTDTEAQEVTAPRPASARRKGRSKAAVTDTEVENLPSIPEILAPDMADEAEGAAAPIKRKGRKKAAVTDAEVEGLPSIPEPSASGMANEADGVAEDEQAAEQDSKPKVRKASARLTHSKAEEGQVDGVSLPLTADFEQSEAERSAAASAMQPEDSHADAGTTTAKKTRVTKKQKQQEIERMEREEDLRQQAAVARSNDTPAGGTGGAGMDKAEEVEEMEEDEDEDEDEEVALEHDIYEELYGGGIDRFPARLIPRNLHEFDQMMFQMETEQYLQRQHQAMEVEDLAWQSHHMQNERGVNKYANVRRVAGLMTAFEADDYAIGPAQPGNLSSWARSEVAFAEHFDDFNEYIAENLEEMVKRTSQEEKQEELDIMDDVLLLPPLADEREVEKFPTQQEQDDMLVNRYLEGILPGVSLNNMSDRFADDIFTEDEYEADADATETSETDELAGTASDSDGRTGSDLDV